MARVGIKEIVVTVTDAEGLAVGEVVVDLGHRLIAVLRRRAGEEQRAGEPISVVDGWVRIQRENLLHGRVGRRRSHKCALGSRNSCLSDEWRPVVCPSLGQVHRVPEVIEYTCLERCCRHGGIVRQSSAEPVQFVVEEEERLVLDDRPANGIAELVADVGILRARLRSD